MLKNLQKNIPLLFRKLGLGFQKRNSKNLEKAICQLKGFYTDGVNDDFFLKVKIKRDKRLKIQLKREIRIYKYLKTKFNEKLRFFPKLITFSEYKNLPWLLEKREIGKLAGKMDEDFGMKKNFLLKTPPFYFVNLINLYQNIKPKLRLQTHGGRWYLYDFNHYKKKFLNEFINSKLNQNLFSWRDLKVIEMILKKNEKFLTKEAKYLSHGDLYSNNIILNKEGKIIFLDWSWAHYNIMAFDIAFIYLLAHRFPDWQKKFLNCYLRNIKEKDKFKKLFNLSLISLTIRFAAHCYFHIEEKREVLLIFKKHLKVLKNTIEQLNL